MELGTTKFPVFSLINREFGPETGSLETGSSAIPLFLDVSLYRISRVE
jgi:hypothetical protein